MSNFHANLALTKTVLNHITDSYLPAVFASSLAAEDMVLTDLILKGQLPISIFTLDTGRLHTETLEMVARIRETYGADISVYAPSAESVSAYIRQHGMNGFYDSVDARKECCRIRKVLPLQRALTGSKAWITGQRRLQAATRAELAVQEFDTAHGIAKFNPLADWSAEDIWQYLRTNSVPYNPLHDHGYPSIGCEPCTRAIQPGESIRAGRWWWEEPGTKECGLHLVDGKLVRTRHMKQL
ncbi:MAG: phosphoadenylyl-sulfate reductase [Burkholderiaceae bacterium]|jgi:phosphoadenosine phosphosulfate reductase|nr:phosphoadenylyl-sulfate reductase [Burkholderiaceae bacterium]